MEDEAARGRFENQASFCQAPGYADGQSGRSASDVNNPVQPPGLPSCKHLGPSHKDSFRAKKTSSRVEEHLISSHAVKDGCMGSCELKTVLRRMLAYCGTAPAVPCILRPSLHMGQFCCTVSGEFQHAKQLF